MSPDRYQQLCQLCDDADAQPPPLRAEFLRRACPDSSMRAEAEAMLAADDDARARGFLGTLGSETTAPLAPEPDLERAISRRIGPYAIRQIIGQGGMGSVYRAERVEGDFRQVVAIKIIRPDRDCAEVARRFRTERQILAGLKHTNIAALLHADTTSDGQPYLVMEFIEGEPIDRACQRPDVSTPRRLEMVATICDAIQYAHQRMVIHRDIKPSNILIDARGQPKILDFGIARVTNPELQATTAETEAGRILGTLAYMSPEQVSGRPEEIDTRTDVYALGVLCFQLLAGRLPHRLEGMSLPEAILQISKADAPALSSVNRAYRGDLDTIVAKALSRDKAARYASASEVATDLRHYLRNEPIKARPFSSLYLLSKFARRNRGLVAAVVVVFFTLVIGVIGTGVGLVRARAALEESQQHMEESQRQEGIAKESARQTRLAVSDSLATIANHEGLRKAGFEPLRRDLLQKAIKHYRRVAELHGEDPELLQEDAKVHHNLALTLREMNQPAEALPLAQDAVRFLETLVEARPSDQDLRRRLGMALNLLSMIYGKLSRPTESEATLVRFLEIAQSLTPPDLSSEAMAYTNLAISWADKGKMPKALEMFQRAHSRWERSYTEKPMSPWAQEQLVQSWNHLGNYYVNDEPGKAEECFRKLQAVAAKFPVTTPMNTNLERMLADNHNLLGKLLGKRGQFEKALEEVKRESERREVVLAQSPPSVVLRDELLKAYDKLYELQILNLRFGELAATDQKRKQLAAKPLPK